MTSEDLNRCINRLLDLDPVAARGRELFFAARDSGKSQKEAATIAGTYIWNQEQGGSDK